MPKKKSTTVLGTSFTEIVLHFISKEVPLQGSRVFKGGGRLLLSSRLAVKNSGMLALVGVRPQGEPVIP